MRRCLTCCVAVAASAAFAASATAMSRPGPAPAAPTYGTVKTAASLPGGRYPWVQPAFVRLPSGLFHIARITVA